MSKFYGYVRDEWGNRTAATRCGHEGITAAAQSYDGSVITDLRYEGDELVIRIEIANGSANHGEQVFVGNLAKLRNTLRYGH